MAARKKNASKDAAPGSPAASSGPGDDGAEVAEERVEVVTYAAAIGVVIRISSADAWAVTRRLLGAGVRIGTEEHLARRMAAKSACTTCGDLPSDGGEERS